MLNYNLKFKQPLIIKSIILKLVLGFVTLFFNNIAIAQESSENKSICEANLSREIDTIINSSNNQKYNWGIKVESLNSDQILYQLNANKYFIPASNIKLLSTAAALLKFGDDYRIKTPVYMEGDIPYLKSLRIVGKGDPTLTNKDLIMLAERLKKMGVTQIENLIVEDGYLPPPIINHTWEWTDLYYYYAVPANSLILNENTFILTLLPQEIGESVKIEIKDSVAKRQWLINNKTVTSEAGENYNISLNMMFQNPVLEFEGSLPIDSKPDIWAFSIINPNEYFLESLRQKISEKGILIINSKIETLSNQNLLLNQQNKEQELLSFESPSLAELIKTTNQDSNNLFAEVLLKTLIAGEKDKDLFTELKNILTQLGVDENGYYIKDGAGLSHHNLATPQTFVQLLKLIKKTKYGEIYRESLAVAGVNGTLKNRFKNTTVEGNLQGKTGTISRVSALSGYLEIPDYQPLVFSIIVNQAPEKSSNLRQTIDEIVIILSQLRRC